MSRFRICRQTYTEVMNLYFERSTWASDNASSLLRALLKIPVSLLGQIYNLAISIELGRVFFTDVERRKGECKQHPACSMEEPGAFASRLRSLK